MMRPVAILKLAPLLPAATALASSLGTMTGGAVTGGALAGAATGAATGAASTAAATGVGAGLGSALMQGAKKKIGQVGVMDAASIAQNASDKSTERAQQAQQNNIQSSQDLADKAKEKADLTKGQYYPPSIGGYLEQRYTGGTQDGVETNKKIKPGGEVTRNPGGEVPPPGSQATYFSPEWQTNIERLSNQQQYGYDIPQKQLPVAVQPTEAPVESFTGELPDSTWSSYDNHGLQQLKDRERIYENEHQEVMNRITESLREYLNPDGTYKKGVPTQFAIRTHILDEQRKGVGLDKRGNEKSNGDSIVAIINPHLDDPTRPALRTVMLRNSEFSTDTTPQPFSPTSSNRTTGLKNVQKVIHADGMSKRERDVRFKAAQKIRRDNGIRELNTDIVQTGEPMDIAMRLLKYSLELESPLTQGVEETPPIQEDIPTVDIDTMGGGDGDCCEKVREWLLSKVRPNTEGYNEIMNASCEEIKSGQVGTTRFLYDKIAELLGCSEGFDSDWQNIHTGEPMDIAMRLLKQRDRIFDPLNEGIGEEGVDFHPGDEGVDWDSAVSSSLYPGHDLEQRHPNDPDMHEYDHHAQKLLGLMANRDITHLQDNEKPMTEDEQFDLMDAQQKLQASIPKNVAFPSIQNAVGYDKDGNKTSTFGDGRPKFNEGSPRWQEIVGDRPTVPMETEGSFYGTPFNEKNYFTTGEPMEIALRLLKDSVHLTHDEELPHQFSQDIANLDHKHEITPTDSGSTINNIQPDMLRTIELMAQNYQENTPVQEEVYEPPTYF